MKKLFTCLIILISMFSFFSSRMRLSDIGGKAVATEIALHKTSSVTKPEKMLLSESADTKTPTWMAFKASAEVLKLVYELHIQLKKTNIDINFPSLVAYVATQNSNNFNLSTDKNVLNSLHLRLKNGEIFSDIVKDKKYFNYYLATYGAVLKTFVGSYVQNEVHGYGLTAYHPIAAGFYATEFNDFGQRRNYGYNRPHLGHDFMGNTGTPIIAVEGGNVIEYGWNRYGGWRLGILSHDKQRFYYYAHLKKGHPYASDITIDATIIGGQVIGFLGATGYSKKENTNMNCQPHLHFGMQILFTPSQYNTSKEVWIDVYQIVRFLQLNKAKTVKENLTNEYKSINLKLLNACSILSI